MSGLLADAYEDSDEDDNAPSILTRAAQEAEGAAAPAAAAAPQEPAAAAPGNAEDAGQPGRAPPTGGAPPAGGAGPAQAASPLVASSSASSSGELSDGGGQEEAEEAAPLVPPSPPGEPDVELVDRVMSLHSLWKRGKSIREHIQGSRDWSNPYVLERVIKVFELDQYGSNYPKDVFDPSRVAEHPSDYFDAPECERPPLPKRPKRGADHGRKHRHRDGHRRNGASQVPPASPALPAGSDQQDPSVP
mmetsp:Transcript_87350/g.260617  ORF Transcript_87350/g.260617 Transcript_87350/m.260617 type:complete len:247 (+) Transcript_87350:34-774(+)